MLRPDLRLNDSDETEGETVNQKFETKAVHTDHSGKDLHGRCVRLPFGNNEAQAAEQREMDDANCAGDENV